MGVGGENRENFRVGTLGGGYGSVEAWEACVSEAGWLMLHRAMWVCVIRLSDVLAALSTT
jgi:hypothetical protein